MIDDTREDPACSITGAQLSASIEEISKHTTSRVLAKAWARRLRFLTFDDGPEVATVGANADGRKLLCGRCESGYRIPPGHYCDSHRPRKQVLKGLGRGGAEITATEETATASIKPNACQHIAQLTCHYCEHIPLFPSRKKATRFRIRRVVQKDADMGMDTFHPPSYQEFPCGHFVAVSYCWSSQAPTTGGSDIESEPYIVVEEDGTVREIRATKSTIDRAVSFAAQNGYRMIWIDQECIPQDNAEEQQIGIQAMDIVYLSAHITIGLFQATLKQRHLEALIGGAFEDQIAQALSLGSRGKPTRAPPQKIRSDHLTEALELVVNDRWNSRAWILQEAFASAGNMVILFPKERNIQTNEFRLICHEVAPSSEICIDFQILHVSLKVAAGLISTAETDPNPALLDTLHRSQWLHPEFPKNGPLVEFSIGRSKVRETCSASMALAFLRHRQNSIVADRLAIIANMCGYERRLNIGELGQNKAIKSLAVCVLTLSIINGDFSLLTPELHDKGRVTMSIDAPLRDETLPQRSTFLEILQFGLQSMPWVHDACLNPRGPDLGHAAPESFFLQGNSIRLPGLLWKAKDFCELKDIQIKYRRRWDSLNSDLDRLIETTPWSEADRRRAQTRGRNPFNTAAYEHMERRKRAITQILFDMLESLRARGEIRVADAIWQSVWNPEWMNAKRTLRPVHSVKDFPRNLKVESRGAMFRLYQDSQFSFQCEWIIDRVMRKGGLWAATLVRKPKDDEFLDNRQGQVLPGRAPEFMGDLFDEAHGLHSDLESEGHNVDDTPEPVSEQTRKGVTPELSLEVSELLDMPVQRGMLAFVNRQLVDMFLSLMSPYPTSASGITGEVCSRDYATQSLHFLHTFGEGGMDRLETLKDQCAIFDVDGAVTGRGHSTLILTPFYTHVERVPAPVTRGMGISWVVEPVEGEKDGGKYEKFRLADRYFVRGMWRVMLFPGGRYTIV